VPTFVVGVSSNVRRRSPHRPQPQRELIATSMAQVVKRNRSVPVDWGAVAEVHRSLQTVIDEHDVEAQWLNLPEEGGWLREIELELDTGGLACLEERRLYPGEFTVHLVRHRDMFYVKQDFEEVIAFLKVTGVEVTVFSGQVLWWKKKPPVNRSPETIRGHQPRLHRGDA
jgi:hypothetical protein